MKKFILPILLSLVLALMAFKEYKISRTNPETNEVITSEPANALVVLELFTSQGCSSCPPADVLLKNIKKLYPDNVLALSYHVDYWNYIGWEDPFSSTDFTQKQRDYNLKFRSRSNYTPQLVINGKEHLVGSHKARIVEKIEAYKRLKPTNTVRFEGKKTGNQLHFNYELSGDLSDKELRIVTVLNERTTQVNRGENSNRTLKNANIVIGEKLIKNIAPTGNGAITIPALVTTSDEISLFLLIQNQNLEITGGAKLAINH